MTPLQKLPKNVGDLDKLAVAKGFKKGPRYKKITQSGHTAHNPSEAAPIILIGVELLNKGLKYGRGVGSLKAFISTPFYFNGTI